MTRFAKWSDYPLSCMFGFHRRRQHPGIPSFWYCLFCHWMGRRRVKDGRERGSYEVLGGLILAVIMIVGWVGYSVAWNNSRTNITCVVDSKQATSNKYGGNQYLIFTKNCGQLTVADSFWHGKYNSTDTYARIHEGHSYTFDTVGWRNGFFSTYPNVLEVSE